MELECASKLPLRHLLPRQSQKLRHQRRQQHSKEVLRCLEACPRPCLVIHATWTWTTERKKNARPVGPPALTFCSHGQGEGTASSIYLFQPYS